MKEGKKGFLYFKNKFSHYLVEDFQIDNIKINRNNKSIYFFIITNINKDYYIQKNKQVFIILRKKFASIDNSFHKEMNTNNFMSMNSLFGQWKRKHFSNQINLPRFLIIVSKQSQLDEYIAFLSNINIDYYKNEIKEKYNDERRIDFQFIKDNDQTALSCFRNSEGSLNFDINQKQLYEIDISMLFVMYQTKWNLPFDQQSFLDKNFIKRNQDNNILIIMLENTEQLENSPVLQYLHQKDPGMSRILVLVQQPEQLGENNESKRKNIRYLNKKSTKLGIKYFFINLKIPQSVSKINEELQQIYIQRIQFQIPFIYRDVMKKESSYIQQIKSLEEKACYQMKIEEFFQFNVQNNDIESEVLQKISYVSNYIRESLDGQYPVDITSNGKFGSFSLRSLMDMEINRVFQEVQIDLLNEIKQISDQMIQESMKHFNNQILDGFLSVQVFKSLYFRPMNLLINPMNSLLQSVHEMTAASLIGHFTRHLRYFQFHPDLIQFLKSYTDGVYKELCDFSQKFLNLQINTIFVPEQRFWDIQKETYELLVQNDDNNDDNFDRQQRELIVRQRIYQQIQQKGQSYVQKMLDIISQTIPRMLYSLYFGVIQENLYMKVYQFFIEMKKQNKMKFEKIENLQKDEYYKNFESLRLDLDLCQSIQQAIMKDQTASQFISQTTFVQGLGEKLNKDSMFNSDPQDDDQEEINEENKNINGGISNEKMIKDTQQKNKSGIDQENEQKNQQKTESKTNQFLNWFKRNKNNEEQQKQNQQQILNLRKSEIIKKTDKKNYHEDHEPYRNTYSEREEMSRSFSVQVDNNGEFNIQKKRKEVTPEKKKEIFSSLFGNSNLDEKIKKKQKETSKQQDLEYERRMYQQKAAENKLKNNNSNNQLHVEEYVESQYNPLGNRIKNEWDSSHNQQINPLKESHTPIFQNERQSNNSENTRTRRNSTDSRMTFQEQENDTRKTNLITQFVVTNDAKQKKTKRQKAAAESKLLEQSKLIESEEIKQDEIMLDGSSSQSKKEESLQNIQKMKKKYHLSRDIDWLYHIHNNSLQTVDRDVLITALAKGVPSTLRPAAWMLLAEVTEKKASFPKDYFKNLSETSSEMDEQINKDIPRTYPGWPYFKNYQYDGKVKIFKILRAYANHNQNLGYTQGMNNIAAVILMTLDHYGSFLTEQEKLEYLSTKESWIEQNSFWILKYIMDDLKWEEYIGPKTTKLVEVVMVFDDLLKQRLPDIATHFQNNCVNGFTLFTTYFVTLHTYNSPLQFSQRVLDLFLVQGVDILKETLINMLETCRKDILEINDMEKLFNFVKYDLGPFCFSKYKRELDQIMK